MDISNKFFMRFMLTGEQEYLEQLKLKIQEVLNMEREVFDLFSVSTVMYYTDKNMWNQRINFQEKQRKMKLKEISKETH